MSWPHVNQKPEPKREPNYIVTFISRKDGKRYRLRVPCPKAECQYAAARYLKEFIDVQIVPFSAAEHIPLYPQADGEP